MTITATTLPGHEDDSQVRLGYLRSDVRPRRGMTTAFLAAVAKRYGEMGPNPVAALARDQGVDISTASRWVTAARARGLIEGQRP